MSSSLKAIARPLVRDCSGVGGVRLRQRVTKGATTRPGSDWSRGVMRVLAGAAHHGLRDAYRDLHGFDSTPITHLTPRGGKRCFDHAFVSRHFEVEGCGYHHDWRRRRLSDHSAMWLELKSRTDLPELVA